MIRVVSKWEQDLLKYSNPDLYGAPLSEGLITPTECRISEEAGGSYSMTLKHPIDREGRWKLIQPLALICAPIPRTELPAIDSGSGSVIGVGSEVWLTTGECYLYSSTTSAYRAWISGEGYYPGDRVSHHGYNWECQQITLVEPSVNAAAWRRLGPIRYVIKTLPRDTTLVVSSKDATWLHVTLLDGTAGWVYRSNAEYQYTVDDESQIPETVTERTLTHQLFRVTDITMDGKSMTLQANCQHVSYDWSASIIGQTTLKETPLPTAIAAVRSAVLPDGVQSAPKIYAEDTENTVTASCTRKSLTSIMLDPEEGIVAQARARLVRDEKDFFLLAGDGANRGCTIRYGVNLTGVTWRRDYSKLVTRAMPVAKDANGQDYFLPEMYVDSDLRDSYPIDYYQAWPIDAKIGDDGATEADVQQKMREEAQKRYSEEEADRPVTTLTVEFLMLGDTEEYAQYRGLERLSLYDTVEIFHPDIGLSTGAQVKSYEWDAIRCRFTRITLGDAFEAARHTVYGYNLADGAIGARKLTPEAIAEIRNG